MMRLLQWKLPSLIRQPSVKGINLTKSRRPICCIRLHTLISNERCQCCKCICDDMSCSRWRNEEYITAAAVIWCAFLLADLKKTLAVLLDNIMLRLGKLESKVENIYNGTGGNLTNGTGTVTPSSSNAEKVNVAGRSWIFLLETH